MAKVTAWISILFGLHTVGYAIFADTFEGYAELPLPPKGERDRLSKEKPSVWARVGGVLLGLAFCAYGVYGLYH